MGSQQQEFVLHIEILGGFSHRGAQIFQKSRPHLKFLGAKW
jgi:hypothetical protein